MIEINNSPYRTSQNYVVNGVFVDENDIKANISNFDGFSQKTASECKFLSDFDTKTTQIIAEKLEKQIENEANFKKQIEISDSNFYEFDFDLDKGDFVGGIKFLVKSGVKSQIVLKFHSTKKSYANHTIKFVCEKDSSLDVAVVFDFEKKSSCFVCFDCKTEENAKLNVFVADFGCKNSIQNFYSKIIGRNSECNLKTAYLGDNENLIDMLYIQDLYGEDCRADIDAVGALGGNARKSFRSVISFEKGCKKSFGSENEFCLLLSDEAKSKAVPLLLCGEEDVDGKHSTSIGRADEKQLFYIMSRGVDKTEALKLIVKAKFNKFVESLFDENLKEFIYEKIDKRLEDGE